MRVGTMLGIVMVGMSVACGAETQSNTVVSSGGTQPQEILVTARNVRRKRL